MDLTSHTLPLPRLPIRRVNDQTGVTVPAFTDLKLHDITTGPGDPNAGPLDQNQQAGSAGFFAGNTKFITRKLWGLANAGPFIHHGKFTTTREAVLNHNGEVAPSKPAFQALTPSQRDNMIEFLKPLQTLPQTAHCLVVHENFDCKR